MVNIFNKFRARRILRDIKAESSPVVKLSRPLTRRFVRKKKPFSVSEAKRLRSQVSTLGFDILPNGKRRRR